MTHPYEIWETRRLLGVFRATNPMQNYWGQFVSGKINSEDEYIDFEKLPVRNRKVAAFALPLARGKSVYDDSAKLYRFKPAYMKIEDQVDPLKPLVKQPGIDSSMIEESKLSPVERARLIKAVILAEHRAAWERLMEWLRAKAIADGQVTLSGEDYPTTVVNFGRSADNTVVLGSGERFGDNGVSILDFFESMIETMGDAEFGGVPTRATMGGGVWSVMRQDDEIIDHLDRNVAGGVHIIDRGLTPNAKIFKVGELQIGGNSGQKIELWVNNEICQNPAGVTERFVANTDIVFTSTAEAINAFDCFGRIIDPKANYAAVDFFPSNWVKNGDPEAEYITGKSAPLVVPVNPDATAKATVIASS